jgi:flavin-dependent thymidylate synthase
MKVTLVNYDPNALDMLIFSKSTRLGMSPELLDDIRGWPMSVKMDEAEYISNTIKSSWEFVDYTFMIEGVSRAFTHQFVRNRQGSYAQQTMRMLDVSGFEYTTGPSFENSITACNLYHDTMATLNATYMELLQMGIPEEDARGILPTNICTNIMAKYNLRTLSELVASRSSPRTQDEFRRVMSMMHSTVIEVHPWAEMFLENKKVKAARELDKFADGDLQVIKHIDILRK